MQYYTDLRWVRTVKGAVKKEQKELNSIFDILKVTGAGQKPTNILVKGKLIAKLIHDKNAFVNYEHLILQFKKKLEDWNLHPLLFCSKSWHGQKQLHGNVGFEVGGWFYRR